MRRQSGAARFICWGSALVLPATALAFRPALAWGAAYTVAYFGVALATGIDWSTLESTARLEAFSTHLMVPMLVTLALAHARLAPEDLAHRVDRILGRLRVGVSANAS